MISGFIAIIVTKEKGERNERTQESCNTTLMLVGETQQHHCKYETVMTTKTID